MGLIGAVGGLLAAGPALAQTRDRSRALTPEQLEQLQHRHRGQAGALDPANLAKKRPKPPFDMTGTWFIDLTKASANSCSGRPIPNSSRKGKRRWPRARRARRQGQNYRDSIGQCYPAGHADDHDAGLADHRSSSCRRPSTWSPASPTASARSTSTGASTPIPTSMCRPITANRSANGKATRSSSRPSGFETDHHWIDIGIPVSDDFQMIERIKLINSGNTLEIEYIMTDPKMWKGEWRNTKRWDRVLEATSARSNAPRRATPTCRAPIWGQEALDAAREVINAGM
jgi:hypothetical protein